MFTQGLDLLLNTLRNSSPAVSSTAREVFLPAFASWAQELNRLETSLVTAIVKRLEVAAVVRTFPFHGLYFTCYIYIGGGNLQGFSAINPTIIDLLKLHRNPYFIGD